jgi:hypothetical protein
MSTRLRYAKGTQFFSDTGAPLACGTLTYYEAGTTSLSVTYSDPAGENANTNPLILNSAGRLVTDVYLGDASDYKEVLAGANSAVITPWPDDNIPKAEGVPEATLFAGAAWPQATETATAMLTASDLNGRWINADTSADDMTLTLPSAVDAGAGYGGIVRKSAAANTLHLAAQGTQTINGVYALDITNQHDAFLVLSDGANWFAFEWMYDGTVTAAKLAATLICDLNAAEGVDRGNDYVMVQSNAECGLRKVLLRQIDKREPDSLHSLTVISQTLAAPPASPSEGDRYIVAASPTGEWAGRAGAVASYFGGAWNFYAPQAGWLVWVQDESLLYVYSGAAWTKLLTGQQQIGITSPCGSSLIYQMFEESLTLSGASVTSVNQIPAGAIVFAVSTRVLTAITGSGGAGSFEAGQNGASPNLSQFGSSLGFSAGSTNRGIIGPTGFYANTPIQITATSSGTTPAGTFTGGEVRITCHYALISPPMS